MVARVRTVAFQGIETLDIDVQVQMTGGTIAFTVVGLPDKAVAESRERVRGALVALGLALPPKRITVNLAPADVLKEGSHFDLPIALALLVAMEILSPDDVMDYVVLGELGLDAQLAPVAGVLPAAFAAAKQGLGIICPAACGGEARWAGELDVLAPSGLLALINHFKGNQVLTPPDMRIADPPGVIPDLSEVKGQDSVKRVLEIAAAGGHNLLMMGPPGSGKSMLAARLPGLLPPMDAAEALEISMIHSLAGQLEGGKLLRHRPFRDPHFSASVAALVGGGIRAKPGEISLAHTGVLFLDEFPEFNRGVLEALRQPLETGRATVARANAHYTYPARFQLVAAMNPCRCGYLGDPIQGCRRAPHCGADYQSKISGPMMDRIDLHIDVEAVAAKDLSLPAPREKSADIAARVATARGRQKSRIAELAKAGGKPPATIRCNAELEGDLLEQVATPTSEGMSLLQDAAEHMRLSARAYHRVLRVARTIADLEGVKTVSRPHIAEALTYRRVMPSVHGG
ncbi:MAG: YifB family Mg chelatase-like AAA ATPase [Alphaproteobacteria bacterium]|nr:YifB family Mg chelatase-like AAA ATPase [Alphaproteobacteria bacterium]